MTYEEFSRTLRYMEQLREEAYESDVKQANRLMKEYRFLEKSIEPYVNGKEFARNDPL